MRPVLKLFLSNLVLILMSETTEQEFSCVKFLPQRIYTRTYHYCTSVGRPGVAAYYMQFEARSSCLKLRHIQQLADCSRTDTQTSSLLHPAPLL